MLERFLNTQPIAPEAHPEFRSELRKGFVSGEIAHWDEPQAEEFSPSEPRSLWQGSLRVLLPLAAAAAAVLLVLRLDRDPLGWSLRPISGAGAYFVGETELDSARAEASHVDQLAAGGTRIRSLDRRLLLELGNQMRLQLEPQTTVEFGALPEDGVGGSGQLEVQLVAGRLIGTTGPEYASNALLIHTPRGDATVVGTSFAFDALDQGCCICVAKGHVQVQAFDADGALGDEVHDVRSGVSRFFPTAGGSMLASLVEGGGHLGDVKHAVEHGRALVNFMERYGF